MNTGQIARMVLMAGLAGPALAAQCETEIEGNDAMQFNKSSIDVPQSCKKFTVKLKHPGKLPKTAMGHNWVLSKTADMQGVVNDGIAAGAGQGLRQARRCARHRAYQGDWRWRIRLGHFRYQRSSRPTGITAFSAHSRAMRAVMKGKLSSPSKRQAQGLRNRHARR